MVEQLARQLAEELINSEYGKAFSVAKKAYDEDKEAQQMVQDYINMQNNFQDKLGTGNVTDEEKDKFYDDINKLNNRHQKPWNIRSSLQSRERFQRIYTEHNEHYYDMYPERSYA